MTELFIDGVSVVLPKGFSIQVKRENPFFTKNGEYTYDITLSLSNQTNAELYSHLNRLNSVEPVKTKRSAVLVSNNRVYCNGTEIIIGWTEEDVSIQIASGNSELNYFIGYDLLISFLKMKSSDVSATITESGLDKMAKAVYPEHDFCLPTVYNRNAGYHLNEWRYEQVDTDTENQRHELRLEGKHVAQPFLCAYIKEVLRAIGYELLDNQLEGTPYAQLYLCHVEETEEWCKMLPGIRVQDFLENVEKLFNMLFVVDNRRRTARLLFRNSYFMGLSSVHVQQVEDMYEVEVEEPEVEDNANASVSYLLPDNSFWRWHCMPELILGKAVRKDIPEEFGSSGLTPFNRLMEWFGQPENRRKDILFHDLKTKRHVVFTGMATETSNIPYYRVANDFVQLKREEATVEVEIEMIPVEFSKQLHVNAVGGVEYWYPPTIDGLSSSSAEEVTSESPILSDLLDDGAQEESESGEKRIYLAFYGPMGSEQRLLPFSYIDEYMMDDRAWFERSNSVGASLRLQRLNELFYQVGYDIDYTRAVKVRCHDANVYGAMLIFEIRNKRYVCKEMEFTLDAYGRKGAWTGTFYPIRISDIEADVRWILADGKWRDGGVWLDNGRWLDE